MTLDSAASSDWSFIPSLCEPVAGASPGWSCFYRYGARCYCAVPDDGHEQPENTGQPAVADVEEGDERHAKRGQAGERGDAFGACVRVSGASQGHLHAPAYRVADEQ